jgi:hypothetical protein
MSFLINMALNKIHGGIQAHAKENGLPETDLYLMIYPRDADYNPGFKICRRVNVIKEVTFAGLIKMSSVMGFPIDKEGEAWVKKFLVKAAIEKDLPHDAHFYFIRIRGNGLQAYLYVNNQPKEEISLDYILKTE